jgi:MFS family permease
VTHHLTGIEITASRAPRTALALLLLVNLFNYLGRQILAAVVGPLKTSFLGTGLAEGGRTLAAVMPWFQLRLGFKPEDALIGLLGRAFLLTDMIGAPLFARLAERFSRWRLIGIAVILWNLASGALGWALTFSALLLTRCLVGIGEAAYGPVAPAIIADRRPVQRRGHVLAWFVTGNWAA